MKVFKIVTLDQKSFICSTQGELERFIDNYETDKAEYIKTEFPESQFLVDHIEVINMDEEEYHKLPATVESSQYFRMRL